MVSAGASHAYELQEQMTPLPQPGHLHTADAEFQLLPRPTAADLVEANPGNGWGFLSPLLAMCIPSWLVSHVMPHTLTSNIYETKDRDLTVSKCLLSKRQCKQIIFSTSMRLEGLTCSF